MGNIFQEKNFLSMQKSGKAEVEIRMLHEKMGQLILNQQQHLIEIQHIQVEMLKEIAERINR